LVIVLGGPGEHSFFTYEGIPFDIKHVLLTPESKYKKRLKNERKLLRQNKLQRKMRSNNKLSEISAKHNGDNMMIPTTIIDDLRQHISSLGVPKSRKLLDINQNNSESYRIRKTINNFLNSGVSIRSLTITDLIQFKLVLICRRLFILFIFNWF
jgi:hypothetical protein